MSLTVAICIATRNRREDLARTLGVVERLDPPPAEVLIMADGCTDGTVEFLRAAHPKLRVIIHEQPRGSIPSRNELAAACACDVFASLDDDSYPLEMDFIARVRTIFTDNPRLAVASFPQRTDEHPGTLSAPDFGPSTFVGTYANSSAAIRTAVFRELGGYPNDFFHMYEEPDFALRCVAAGWQVRYETSLTVRHHYSGRMRSELRAHHRHARNELWSVLMRCPAPHLAAVALFRIARQFGYAWWRGLAWAVREPAWWLAALRGARACWKQRRPLPWARYRAWMALVRRPLQSEAEWEKLFGNSAP